MPEHLIRNLLSRLFRRMPRKVRPAPRRRRLEFEALEPRLTPSGTLLVTTAGSYPQQFFKEFSPTGGLVRALVIPPPLGSGGDTARDLTADASGKVYVYNGTFSPSLATYDPKA